MTTTAPAPADLQVQMLDPRTLLVDRNVRREPALDKDFVASVRDHGVLVPIVAVQAPDGVRVRHGERRTRAVIEAGRATVPVVVVGLDGDDKDAEIDRVLTQYAENEHRTGLTTGDRVDAFEQLAAFGLSAAAIARRTHTPRARVNTTLTVARSDVARGAHDRYDFLDLEQAAVVAEFDVDPEAVKALVVAAKAGGFAHVAQRLRDQRAEREGRDRAAAELAERGVRVVDRPAAGEPSRQLERLDHDGTPLTPDSHAHCPGHAAYVVGDYEPTRTDGAGSGFQRVFKPEYVCTDPDSHGHVDRYRPSPVPSPTSGTNPTAGTTGPSDSPDALSEAAKAERRRVIENNKAWRSATTVRRDWLQTFLSRKTPPKGAGQFVACCLAAGDHELRRALERNHPTGSALLGAADESLADVVDRASEQRSHVVTLGLVLGAYEDSFDVQTWRYPSPAARRYLDALAAWGYELADVERLVTDVAAGSDDRPGGPNQDVDESTDHEAATDDTAVSGDDTTPTTA